MKIILPDSHTYLSLAFIPARQVCASAFLLLEIGTGNIKLAKPLYAQPDLKIQSICGGT